MRRNDGKPLACITAVAASGLWAHMALAAAPPVPPQEMSPPIVTARIDPVPTSSPPSSAAMPADVAPAIDAAPDTAQVECIAKVIRHEAANQPIDGQFAVAQVVRARMKDGRFPTTACGVVRQRGQFFDVDAYDPPRDDLRWTTAMRIAAETLNGEGDERADGALFFHAASARMSGRIRIKQIAGHIFYR